MDNLSVSVLTMLLKFTIENIYSHMKKIPHLEINCIPSQLNTSTPTGVAAQLASVAENVPNYDNITLAQMKNNPLYQRLDDIDKAGLAKKAIADSAKIVKSRAKLIRSFNEAAHKVKKPAQVKN